MAKQGQEYEQFVYKKLKRLFADSLVTLNDKILGKQSGLMREIDISIMTTVGSDELLYVVQCKDRGKRPADIVILGEFSSVIKDVGAARGFLICTSGFARSNYRYALTLGIELLTIEDINSDKWKVDIQIPLVYVRKAINYGIAVEIVADEALVEKNRDQELAIHFDVSSLVTLDNGSTIASIKEHIEAKLVESGFDTPEDVELDLLRPNLRISIADVWVECTKLIANLTIARTVYLKYLTPDEYSQIRDHPRGATVPLHVVISGVFPVLDDTFVEIPNGEAPVFSGIYAQIDEWTDVERA